MITKGTHCPPGFHKDPNDGVCRDRNGNPYVKGDQQVSDTQNASSNGQEDTRTDHEKQKDSLEGNKQKAQKIQGDIRNFLAKVKNNEFKSMMESMGLGGLYGMFVLPISAVGSITTLVAKEFYIYYDNKQKKDKITNYDVGYAEGLNKIVQSFDISRFNSPDEIKAFYKEMDDHLEELWNSKAVQHKDKTSKEYGELMAYFTILRQTEAKIDEWNAQGKKKFGDEWVDCDYTKDLNTFDQIMELAKLRDKKRKEKEEGTKTPKKKLTPEEIEAIRERRRSTA